MANTSFHCRSFSKLVNFFKILFVANGKNVVV